MAEKQTDVSTSDDVAALDRLCIYTIRLLSADMVQHAKSGHLGAPFGCAPLANALWGKIMKFSPRKRWVNRDRFILSAGHASALLYSMLHLSGNGRDGPYEVSMDVLKQFRQAGSMTPGHPEFRMTSGVEVTTGPLGQGFANGVGMAIAEAHMAERFNKEGYNLFDHYTYVLAGDGCLMEGVSSEAASLAGHLKLHKLIVFYDDNQVTIDGNTCIAFTEDVAAVFAAKNWNVLHMPSEDMNDSAAFEKIVEEAKGQKEKPTLIMMRTTIGYGVGKGLEGTSKAHGGPYPASAIDMVRKKWFSPEGLRQSSDPIDHKVADLVEKELEDISGWGSTEAKMLPPFHVPRKVMDKFRNFGAHGDVLADEWGEKVRSYFTAFRNEAPELVKDLEARVKGQYLTEGWNQAVNEYLQAEQQRINAALREVSNNLDDQSEPPTKRQKVDDGFKHKAGRVCAADVLKCLVKHNPSIIGGSPDVKSSCGGHFPEIQGTFMPPCYNDKVPGGASYAGRFINFGVREHASLAILNGISSYSCLIPYSTMFTVFYQYALPAMRMASISKFPILYIGTHDSIDLGEDGPTHQPVEVLPQLRAMPNLLVIRPGSVDEMVGAFDVFAEQYDFVRNISHYVDPKPITRRPVFIMTSRGELGLPFKGNTTMAGRDGVKRGAYVMHDCFDPAEQIPNGAANGKVNPLPDIVLIGSGQDVALVMKAKELLLQWYKKLNEQLRSALREFPSSLMGDNVPAPLKVRVVSMPCWELFDEQDQDYQDSVLLSNYADILRIYVEKAATKNTGHDKYAHFSVLMPSYGLSGKSADVERKLEFTPDYIAAKVWAAWSDRGRRLSHSGDEADQGMKTWVSRLGRRVGSH